MNKKFWLLDNKFKVDNPDKQFYFDSKRSSIMKSILIALMIFGSFSLTACAVHTPEGSIVVDPDGRYNDGHGNGRFCPPGQAKKNNC